MKEIIVLTDLKVREAFEEITFEDGDICTYLYLHVGIYLKTSVEREHFYSKLWYILLVVDVIGVFFSNLDTIFLQIKSVQKNILRWF